MIGANALSFNGDIAEAEKRYRLLAGIAPNGSPVLLQLNSDGSLQSGGDDYKTIAASQGATLLGATGAVGDVLGSILVIPATTSPGAVTIADGNGSAITVFAGGATSLSSLAPFSIPLNMKAIAATTPGWRVVTGANLSVIARGDFT